MDKNVWIVIIGLAALFFIGTQTQFFSISEPFSQFTFTYSGHNLLNTKLSHTTESTLTSGDWKFSSDSPKTTIGEASESRACSPRPDCYKVTVKLNGKQFELENGIKQQLDDYVSVTYYGSATFGNGDFTDERELMDSFDNKFVFEIDASFLSINFTDSYNSIPFNYAYEIPFEVNNNYMNLEGGANIMNSSRTFFLGAQSRNVPFSLDYPISEEQKFSFSSKSIETFNMKITPFIQFSNGAIVLSKNYSEKKYEVVPNLVNPTYIEKPTAQIGQFFKKTITNVTGEVSQAEEHNVTGEVSQAEEQRVLGGFSTKGILFFLIIAGIIVYFVWRKNG